MAALEAAVGCIIVLSGLPVYFIFVQKNRLPLWLESIMGNSILLSPEKYGLSTYFEEVI